MSDDRFSDAEKTALLELEGHLGIQADIGKYTWERLERMALLWRIENGQLPVYDVPLTLQRGEQCHFVSRASWHELRTRTVRVDYAGPTASIRICKGVRYRVGSITPRRITKEELTHIDDGTVYITSKRIIF